MQAVRINETMPSIYIYLIIWPGNDASSGPHSVPTMQVAQVQSTNDRANDASGAAGQSPKAKIAPSLLMIQVTHHPTHQ
jgi:hypothetical protein